MKLIIDADLTNPPSEISVFRDITLFSSVFLGFDNLIECENHMKDIYYYWLKSRGAFDFVDDIVPYNKESGITIRQKTATIKVKYLRSDKLQYILNYLRSKN